MRKGGVAWKQTNKSVRALKKALQMSRMMRYFSKDQFSDITKCIFLKKKGKKMEFAS